MMELLNQYNIDVLEGDDDTLALADIYVKEGIIPEKYRFDALHIASATINDIEIIVNLNFQHINKLKTKTMTEVINKREGFRTVYLCTPLEVIENDY
ncbi:MAG: hypothetical protein ACRCUS_07135 [Anaerovoracaceae bacterium]